MSHLARTVGALWLVASIALASGDSPVTLDAIKAEHAAHAAALGTLKTVEQIEIQISNAAEFQRSVIEQGAERRREAQRKVFFRDVDLSKLTPEQRAKLEQRFEQAHPKSDVAAKLAEWKANEQRSLVQFGYYDFGSRRVREDLSDMRDVRAIAKSSGIPDSPAHLLNLDQTRTDIQTPSYGATVRPAYGNDQRELVVLDKGSPEALLSERLERMGIIPQQYLDSRFAIKLSTAPDGSILLCGSQPGSDQPAFEFTLDAGPGHYLTRAEKYDGDGKRTLDLVVEDIRTNNDVTVPFHTQSTKYFPNMGGMVQTESRLIEEFTLGFANAHLPDSLFVGPATGRIQALDRAATDAYQEFQKKLAAPATKP